MRPTRRRPAGAVRFGVVHRGPGPDELEHRRRPDQPGARTETPVRLFGVFFPHPALVRLVVGERPDDRDGFRRARLAFRGAGMWKNHPHSSTHWLKFGTEPNNVVDFHIFIYENMKPFKNSFSLRGFCILSFNNHFYPTYY